jgi:hypothetical protein
MSTFGTPTTNISAVPQQVTQQIANAGEMGLQKQQINNRAMADRNQEGIAQENIDLGKSNLNLDRDKMNQQGMLTTAALNQQKFEALLQSQDNEKRLANNVAINSATNQQTALDRDARGKESENQRTFLKEQQDKHIAETRRIAELQTRIGMAKGTPDPSVVQELQDREKALMDHQAKLEVARKLQLGINTNLNEERLNVKKAIDKYRDGVEPIVDKGAIGGNQYIIGHDPQTSIKKAFGVSIADEMGGVTETLSNLSVATGNTFGIGSNAGGAVTQTTVDFLSGKDSFGYIQSFATDWTVNAGDMTAAERQSMVSRQTHLGMIDASVAASFPQANQAAVKAAMIKAMDALGNINYATGNVDVEKTMGVLNTELSSAGVDPQSFGEMMRRVNEQTNLRANEISSEFGVTLDTQADNLGDEGWSFGGTGGTRAEGWIELVSLKGDNSFHRVVQSMPNIGAMTAWSSSLDGENLTPDRIEEIITQIDESGINIKDLDMDLLEKLLDQFEGGAKDLIGLESQGNEMMLRLESEGRTDSLRNTEYQNTLIEDLLNAP